jgi:hypothetical protein
LHWFSLLLHEEDQSVSIGNLTSLLRHPEPTAKDCGPGRAVRDQYIRETCIGDPSYEVWRCQGAGRRVFSLAKRSHMPSRVRWRQALPDLEIWWLAYPDNAREIVKASKKKFRCAIPECPS